MKCPNCNYHGTIVIWTAHPSAFETKRRRECPKCEKRFTTLEICVKKDEVLNQYNNDVKELNDAMIKAINSFFKNKSNDE